MTTRIISSIFVLMASCSVMFAQIDFNHGLVLRGTHSNWESERNAENDYYVFKAKLKMEFVNDGLKPIILIGPNREFGKWQKKVTFTADCIDEKGKSIRDCDFVKPSNPTLENRNYYLDLASFLDVETPPENVVVILKPGESLQFDDSFELKQTFEEGEFFVGRPYYGYTYCCTKWEGPQNMNGGLSLRSYEKIRVEYEISLLKFQDDPDLLEKLQRRWHRFGYFPVDANGGFLITSEFLRKG